jgi:hypothetical protein
LLKGGKWVWRGVAHSVTRGWQDIVVLLRVGAVNLKMSYTMPDREGFCHLRFGVLHKKPTPESLVGADKGRYGDIVSKGIGEHPAADCGMIVV